MNEVKLNTIRALIGEATPKIGRFEAMILLAHILGKPKEYLIAHDDEELPDTTLMTFDVYVSMRLDGVPVAYLTGRQEFFGRYFTVDHNVLIPRPDTEVLIEQALIVAPEKPEILDMGTGSGCIAVTLAKECPGARGRLRRGSRHCPRQRRGAGRRSRIPQRLLVGGRPRRRTLRSHREQSPLHPQRRRASARPSS